MKFLFSLLAFVMISESCNSKKETISSSVASGDTEVIANKKAQEDPKLTVSYRASTRGYFEVIEIAGDSISYTNDYNQKDYKTFAIPAEDKNALFGLLNTLELKELPTLEPPSKTHQYDAAPAAYLTVTKGDEEFMTPTFDHGKPPKMISDVVEKILSIKSMFDKQ